jgi:RES domain-containing protein
MLEYFVHLDKDDPPDDLVLAVAEVADNLGRTTVETTSLPGNWRDSAASPKLARVGDEFAQEAEHCLLLVPSVLVPSENNYLINPAHPDYKKIVVLPVQPLHYDPRMFGKHSRRRRH